MHYEHREIGYNYRMSNLLAAVGVAQMEVLEERVAQKRAVFDWYQEALSDLKEITWMLEVPGSRGNRWLTTLTFDGVEPIRIIQALEAENIECRPLWKPMHLQPLFDGALSVLDGTSERLFERGICLPSGSAMQKEDVERVCGIIRNHVN
jgi:UDP-N-acetylbacillosamine transaminase